MKANENKTPQTNIRKDSAMNRKNTKISSVFVFATLFMITVSGVQADESIWFSGNESYRPAANYLNGGNCYSATPNSENIFFVDASGALQEATPGICSLTDGKSYNIWFQNNSSL
jgi:hypothetical protein